MLTQRCCHLFSLCSVYCLWELSANWPVPSVGLYTPVCMCTFSLSHTCHKSLSSSAFIIKKHRLFHTFKNTTTAVTRTPAVNSSNPVSVLSAFFQLSRSLIHIQTVLYFINTKPYVPDTLRPVRKRKRLHLHSNTQTHRQTDTQRSVVQ